MAYELSDIETYIKEKLVELGIDENKIYVIFQGGMVKDSGNEYAIIRVIHTNHKREMAHLGYDSETSEKITGLTKTNTMVAVTVFTTDDERIRELNHSFIISLDADFIMSDGIRCFITYTESDIYDSGLNNSRMKAFAIMLNFDYRKYKKD